MFFLHILEWMLLPVAVIWGLRDFQAHLMGGVEWFILAELCEELMALALLHTE